jgi:hypothetical protein
MQTTSNNRITQLQESLARLPWNFQYVERSARLALSHAGWLGIDRDEAIQAVFEMAMGGFFQDNPHIPYQVWKSVSEQVAFRDELELLAA